MNRIKRNYEEEAQVLSKAIDIGIDSLNLHPPKDFNEWHLNHLTNNWKNLKHTILNPEPRFKKIKYLDQYTKEFLTPFQETGGDNVEFFWKKIKELGLPYERENKIREVLKRNKIRNEDEFNYVIDTIVVFEQTGVIDHQELVQLNQLIQRFEEGK